uniref:Aldehyde dehydrogenase domain-containing protein n=2 Tax=Leptocylindrus danicus TaxID=163516 RepID=A0A7S2NQ89_9STRA|mmetsp:Transcript_10243/g.15375  ORF Transcript_10243/g.15375 Transcript_10243/m.15375 type:complete len:566 (+) Transcript_10243:345-2042(+)
MANEVERRMNDLLLQDEEEIGKVEIHRDVAFVGCVSNFGNFLDLCRKVLRNVEVGVPVVVFSRSNSTQHSFRWAQLLMGLMKKYNVDVGLLTYASVTVDEALRIMRSSKESPMYITCSRELACTIKKQHPNLLSSTGGPNTFVSTELTPAIEQAIRDSALIENSGQCTALRHVVVPCTEQEVSHIFGNVPIVSSPEDALRHGQFAGLFESEHFVPIESPDIPAEYLKQPEHDVYYRVCDDLPPDGLNEYWRKVVVDVTKALTIDVNDLAGWLVRNQPISLAVNGDWAMARDLFDKTALVVYTVGTLENPALTCQARPQEKEIFGEFPIRRDLSLYTKYPVIVPSSTPGYNSTYKIEYLNSISDMASLDHKLQYIKPLLKALEKKSVRGFCCELANYIADAVGPKAEVGGDRTVLWGLQRPPLNGTMSVIRCGRHTTLDDMLPAAIPFIITNAREQLEISIDDENGTDLEYSLATLGVSLFNVIKENEETFEKRTFKGTGANDAFFNVMDVDSFDDNDDSEFPLVSQFVSLFLPMGHIKSTEKRDDDFISFFEKSEKWLRLHWHGI